MPRGKTFTIERQHAAGLISDEEVEAAYYESGKPLEEGIDSLLPLPTVEEIVELINRTGGIDSRHI